MMKKIVLWVVILSIVIASAVAYDPQYNSSDLNSIVTDFVGSMAWNILQYVTLFVLIFMLFILMRRFNQIGKRLKR